MSTIAEIENAIGQLPAAEREAFESRLLARRFGLDSLGEDERTELLASLDAGQGHSADELRQAVRSWAGR